ncbi:unnamed protein product [Camellia sinensis]
MWLNDMKKRWTKRQKRWAEPHYGWADVVGNSSQLLSIEPRERPPGVYPDSGFWVILAATTTTRCGGQLKPVAIHRILGEVTYRDIDYGSSSQQPPPPPLPADDVLPNMLSPSSQ